MFRPPNMGSPLDERQLLKNLTAIALIALFMSFLCLETLQAQRSYGKLEFAVSFSKEFSRNRQTGTVYLLVSRNRNGEPRHHLTKGHFDGFILSRDVKLLPPGEPVIFNTFSPAYPATLSTLEPGRYAIQALLDINAGSCQPGLAHGNGKTFSKRMELDVNTSGRIELVIDKALVRDRLERHQRVHYEYIESRIVGRQIGSRFFINASVIMPINAASQPDKKYPVQYWIPDIGEDTRSALKYFQRRGLYTSLAGKEGRFGKEFILVLLETSCKNGFHGWTDSPNNGSFNKALFEEVLPHLESKFPIIPEASSRFLVGKGAGGLAALNLLTDRPDFYAGVWAFAPDPVDFRDFYGLNLFAQPLANAFTTKGGQERVLVRPGADSFVTMRKQAEYERIVRTGNLFQSYDSAYGQLGADLKPMRLIDPDTGRINARLAGRYRARDFKNRVEKWWPRIGKHLPGKINIVVGDEDEFGLHRPVMLLKEFLESKKLPCSIEVLKGVNHGGTDDRRIHLEKQGEMLNRWLASPVTSR